MRRLHVARRLIVCLVLATPLLMASCAPQPTGTPDLVATEVAVQKAAAATLTAEAPTPTHTPAQAETPPIPGAKGTFPPKDTPAVSDTPIPGATATFPPAHTPSPAPGFTIYENRSLGFSAEYPEGWGVEVHDFLDPQTGQAIGKAAEFYSPYDPDGSMLQLLDIAVQVIAGIPGAPAFIPTDEEYREYITDWVTERQQEMVTEPTLVTVDGYTAVQVTYTGTDAFEKYSLVGYGTMLMTEDRVVFVEGVAATENQEEMHNIYEHFMSTFDLLPLP